MLQVARITLIICNKSSDGSRAGRLRKLSNVFKLTDLKLRLTR